MLSGSSLPRLVVVVALGAGCGRGVQRNSCLAASNYRSLAREPARENKATIRQRKKRHDRPRSDACTCSNEILNCVPSSSVRYLRCFDEYRRSGIALLFEATTSDTEWQRVRVHSGGHASNKLRKAKTEKLQTKLRMSDMSRSTQSQKISRPSPHTSAGS